MNDEASSPVPPRRAPASRHDTVLDWAQRTGAGDLLASGLERYLQRRRRRRLVFAATSSAVLLVASVTWITSRDTTATAPVSAPIASATIVRPEQRTLADGSTIDLNASAEIEVIFTDSMRRIVLRNGEAHFQVTKDAKRPFIVSAGAIEVRAVGTAFAVELGTSAVDVLVTEGRVAVNSATVSTENSRPNTSASTPPPTLAALEAGRRFVLTREAPGVASATPRVSELSVADMQARLAWRLPRLRFSATPLAEVVTMFNEHAVAGRDSRLVLASDVPTSLRVSGTLRADDVDSLLRLLAGEFGITTERRAGEIVLRRP